MGSADSACFSRLMMLSVSNSETFGEPTPRRRMFRLVRALGYAGFTQRRYVPPQAKRKGASAPRLLLRPLRQGQPNSTWPTLPYRERADHILPRSIWAEAGPVSQFLRKQERGRYALNSASVAARKRRDQFNGGPPDPTKKRNDKHATDFNLPGFGKQSTT